MRRNNFREVIKEYLAQCCPALYSRIKNRFIMFDSAKHSIKRLICHSPYFYFTIWRKRPYFGPLFRAGQVWPSRKALMNMLIEKELERSDGVSYRILEVGSWAGSSAVLWASACKKKGKGLVFCIDTWEAAGNAPKDMKIAVKNDKILKLFIHNVKTSGLKDYIVALKGSSDMIAEIIKPEKFDFVYLDGDHSYDQFKRDILNYANVVKQNGVLCGDDLEMCADDIDIENAKEHSEEDYICDSKSGKKFHPGVTLGVNDFFGKNVSVQNGFWAMRKMSDGWEKVAL